MPIGCLGSQPAGVAKSRKRGSLGHRRIARDPSALCPADIRSTL